MRKKSNYFQKNNNYRSIVNFSTLMWKPEDSGIKYSM